MKRIIMMGVLQVLIGCIVGLIPPPAVVHFRSIVTAHIEFCFNGILLALMGLLTQYMALGSVSFFILEVTAYFGTFLNGSAFFISAFTGFGTKLSPTINEKFPFPNGIEGGYSDLMTTCLMTSGVTVITCLVISLVGLARYTPINADKDK